MSGLTKNGSTRHARLGAFKDALLEALSRMPAGYPAATHDRERFVTPIEAVIESLGTEMQAVLERGT